MCSAGLLRLRAARWGWRERGRKTFSSAPLFRGQPNEEEGDSLGIKRGIGPSVGRSLGLSVSRNFWTHDVKAAAAAAAVAK